eukprot:gene2217-33777_t
MDEEQASLISRKQEVMAKSKALDRAIASEEPMLRNQLALFAHISKVTWRLDQESRIAGTVSDPDSGDLRSFNMDPTSMSEFDRVNKMWEQL